MNILLNELRLSFIWMERFAHLFLPDQQLPMSFLGQKETYKQEFDQVKAGKSSWTMPWPPKKKPVQRFWKRYLEIAPEEITAERAWKIVAPLRLHCRDQVKASWLPDEVNANVSLEGFFYPHAVACVATIYLRTGLALTEMINNAVAALATTSHYNVTWENGSQEPMSLEGLATGILKNLRETALGKNSPLAYDSSNRFTVATVIKGPQVDPTKIIDLNVHKALQALCNWSSSWNSDQPQDLASAKLPIRSNAPAGHVLYGLNRGRAVWFSDTFQKSGTLHSLGCYHRNLTLLSLQTESLINLMLLADDYLERDDIMPGAMEELSHEAACTIGRLYGAVLETYRSRSARRQIDDSGYIKKINRVRQSFQMDPLAGEATP